MGSEHIVHMPFQYCLSTNRACMSLLMILAKCSIDCFVDFEIESAKGHSE